MADDKKKSEKAAKAYDTIYCILMTLAVIGFGFFAFMKLTDTEIYFYNGIISCYTICFTAAFIFLAVRILTVFRKNGRKISYQMWLMIASAVIAGACLINSLAEDLSRSKVMDTVQIDENTDIFLCETGDEKNTRIDIYRVKGRFARKIGEIDETYFSVKCIEQGAYSYSVSDNGSLFTIYCDYGVYGNGIYMVVPMYDTGTLSFTFELS